eukprot:g2366.t1
MYACVSHGNLTSSGGFRKYMEDAHVVSRNIFGKRTSGVDPICKTQPRVDFYAVFDGHGGAKASKYSASRIVREIRKFETELSNPDCSKREFERCIQSALNEVEAGLMKQKDWLSNYTGGVLGGFHSPSPSNNCGGPRRQVFWTCGTTAILLFVTEKYIVCGNVGDSRAFLSQTDINVPLSTDHKPLNPLELARIRKAGGVVGPINGIGTYIMHRPTSPAYKYAKGGLSTSRSLGDFGLKCIPRLGAKEQLVTCVADVNVIKRDDKNDKFIAMCCDGVFDVLTNRAVEKIVIESLQKGLS